MSLNFVLPRPGAPIQPQTPIQGPSEALFVETFGSLLPSAKYITTPSGKAAYYILQPTSSVPPPFGSPAHVSPAADRVLLIHGVQTPALGMFPLARALQSSFPSTQFVLVDLWGHGLSDTPRLPHHPSLFLDLIDALLDHLEWKTAHFVGYSFGGGLTARYVASRSSKVKSFTLIAPAGLIRYANFSEEEKSYLKGGDEIAARKWVFEWLGGEEEIVPADWKEKVGRGEVIAEAIREWQKREHQGHIASVVAIVRDGGVMESDSEFLKAVQTGVPSLVILGELDDVCNDETLYELGFSNVNVIPEVGHGVVRERVLEVSWFIRDFWKILRSSHE